MKNQLLSLIAASIVTTSSIATPLNDFAFNRSGISVPYQQTPGVSVPGELNEVSRFIVDQLTQNRDMQSLEDNPIAITSLVELENFKSTNKFGLWLGENMMHELQIRGFKTIDFKMMPAIQVTEYGDFVMSKEINQLRDRYNINYVLTGTFTEHPSGIMINVRIVNMESAVIASTAQAHIPKPYYLHMLKGLNGVKKK